VHTYNKLHPPLKEALLNQSLAVVAPLALKRIAVVINAIKEWQVKKGH
jgi:hypothetical protein